MVHACSFHMHAPIMEFLSEGSRPNGQKTAWATLFFLVLSLFYYLQRGVRWFYCRENYTFPRIQMVQKFPVGGVQLFPGGGRSKFKMLISIETHSTCYFPGGPDMIWLLFKHLYQHLSNNLPKTDHLLMQ